MAQQEEEPKTSGETRDPKRGFAFRMGDDGELIPMTRNEERKLAELRAQHHLLIAEAEEVRMREQAMSRVLWLDSREYKKMNAWTVSLLLIFFALVMAATVFIVVQDRIREGASASTTALPENFWMLFAAMTGLVLSGLGFFSMYRAQRRRHFMERQRLGLARDLQEQEKEIAESGGELNLSSLWAVNQRRIEYYHGIATSQSEASFRNGTIASVAGFVLLLAVGLLGAFSASLGGSIAVGIVGVAGAAMASYLGATFMKTQADASAQLRQFFLQPVEFSRLLGAERLIETLPEKDRAAAVEQVIAAMVTTVGPPTPAPPEKQ